MLLTIFGAGASHDSTPNLAPESRPPLVKGLIGSGGHFNTAATRFPAALPVISDLREFLSADPQGLVEQRLAELQESSATNPERARQLLAFRYYLTTLIQGFTETVKNVDGGMTNYVTLLNAIGEWRSRNDDRAALMTLNYDTLLDYAYEAQLGDHPLTFTGGNTRDGYIDSEYWKLFKPHGSINWSRYFSDGNGNASPEEMIARAEHLPLDSGRIVVPGSGTTTMAGEVFVPALAVPTDAKTTFEWPETHLEAFEAVIPQVTAILVIGWRALEPHILEILDGVQNGIDLAVVDLGDEGVQSVVENLGLVAAKARRTELFPMGFSKFVLGRRHREWLELIDSAPSPTWTAC